MYKRMLGANKGYLASKINLNQVYFSGERKQKNTQELPQKSQN